MLIDGTVECWSRTTGYTVEFNTLQPLIGNWNDTNILLDAHDLATFNGFLDLDFITGDECQIKANEALIVNTLQLQSIRLLNEFV
ncbi:MAG: hypothetical protein QHG94_08545, partial [Candidatus Methanosuratincola sp.]|nr:hypothetical protein [Candidatus Methanosuratincola sp.]